MNKITVESNVRKEKVSLVNVTNDREAYPKRWIAVLVQANCEKKTAAQLGTAGTKPLFPHRKRYTNGAIARYQICLSPQNKSKYCYDLLI